MKKLLFPFIATAAIPICYFCMVPALCLVSCAKSGQPTGLPPDPPDTTAKCVSITYSYSNVLAPPDTAYYAFTYAQVKLKRSVNDQYFTLVANDRANRLEIRIDTDSLRVNATFQNPYTRFETRYNDADISRASFVLVIDSIRGNQYSGSFRGDLFDSRLWRPTNLKGEFINAVLQ